jgi:hypothetical protein
LSALPQVFLPALPSTFHSFTLERDENGNHRFGDGTGNWWFAGYDCLPCSF